MTNDVAVMVNPVDAALTRRFLLEYPQEAALKIEAMEPEEVAGILAQQTVFVLLPVWKYLLPGAAADIVRLLPDTHISELLTELPPQDSVRLLGQFNQSELDELLRKLPESVKNELVTLMSYPENSAGRLMDTRTWTFHSHLTVSETLKILRKTKLKTSRGIFLVDAEGRLSAKVHLQDIAISEPHITLAELSQPVTAAVPGTAGKDEISDLFERFQLLDLPVVDIDQRLLGIINHASLVQVSQEDMSSDVLAMVGASREERALSGAWFSVKKRMP
ncbi:MAG: hypothetical protein KKD00_01160, partial [Gammaproteobacteria bacterium]|nr:hypothetical protein [Gammaproteobacteria bacterium]